MLAIWAGKGGSDKGGQDEIETPFMAVDFASVQDGDGDGGGIIEPSEGDVNKSDEEEEEEEEEEEDESTDEDVMAEKGEGGEDRPIARRARNKRGRKKKRKKKRGVQPTVPLQILNAEETKDL